MALTDLQGELLRLLAENRRKTAGSYVAGGLALNFVLGTARASRDIDVFHDLAESLLAGRMMPLPCAVIGTKKLSVRASGAWPRIIK